MRKMLLCAVVAALALALVGCDGKIEGLSDDTYADIWLKTYEEVDYETDAWDKALREYGTSEAEFDAFTIKLLEGDDARYEKVTAKINDDWVAALAYAGYTMKVGLGGLFDAFGTGFDDAIGGLGDLFGGVVAGFEEGLGDLGAQLGQIDEALEDVEPVEEAEEVEEEAAE